MRAFHSRRGDWGGELSDAEAADCMGDSETERCATWWFEHGRADPGLRTIAIRVMHLWTSASPAERNWAEHERVNMARRCKLGFAKLAQLVEIATNLKLASCARQGGGYVLPWVMGTGREGTTAVDEDEEGDVEPEVWGARPAGSVPEEEIQRQIVAFHDSRPFRARSVRDVFGSRAMELRPWPEGGDDVDAAAADDDIDDDWTDDDDTPPSGDPTAERVYFTYGGGRDGMDSFTSLVIGDVPSTAQASDSSRAGGGCGGRSHVEVGVDDSGEQQPPGGLRQTGRRWEVRSDNEAEEEARMSGCPFTIVASLPPIIGALYIPRHLGVWRGWCRQLAETGHMTARIVGGRGLLPTPVSAPARRRSSAHATLTSEGSVGAWEILVSRDVDVPHRRRCTPTRTLCGALMRLRRRGMPVWTEGRRSGWGVCHSGRVGSRILTSSVGRGIRRQEGGEAATTMTLVSLRRQCRGISLTRGRMPPRVVGQVVDDAAAGRPRVMRGRMLSWALGPLVGGVATARPRVMRPLRGRVPPCVAGERVDPVEMGIPRVSGETMDRMEVMTTTTVPRTMRTGSPWC
ncbi:hypothetical protein CBR_g30176 [Chara braunii]|uniref:HAT C-terminal dimerisation domain-containing protein n=1 Tax=Chara braunii TaxID=69332 RepID=A0A388LC78_CHABU|nr:hypothetical protein CBR_g30176 [Chara braunii]|eukprot:GBG79911.1 hypothetical protein CBR_g30176 [Chara braunii]